MHTFVIVLVPPDTGDIPRKVAELLAPYRIILADEPEENDEDNWLDIDHSRFKWDDWEIGGRYSGRLCRGRRSIQHWVGHRFGSHRPEHNIRPVRDLPYDLLPLAVLTPDGGWHEPRERRWLDNEYDQEVIDVNRRGGGEPRSSTRGGWRRPWPS